MKRRFLQSISMQVIYKGICQWFLKIFLGVHFGDNKFLKNETQFIIIANHNSHLDTVSLLAALPRKKLWQVKPVAAEDYFGKTRLKAALSNYFINTLLIQRKGIKDEKNNPIKKMLTALDEGYSLILFPEGTRGSGGQMQELKPGIARILSERPHLKYIPVYMTGMNRLLPKGESILLPYKSSVNYGKPTLVSSTDTHEIMEQIKADFDTLCVQYQPSVHEDDDEQIVY